MKPIGQNVLIKPAISDEVSEGGLFVPDAYRTPSNKGTIVATGDGSPKKPMKVSAGQTCYRVKDWGQEVLVDGELHYLMNQDAVIAIQ